MPSYRVKFFKRLLSSDGHPFKCSQHTVDIDGAASSEEAVRSAWSDYDRVTNGTARLRADEAEAELIGSAGQRPAAA